MWIENGIVIWPLLVICIGGFIPGGAPSIFLGDYYAQGNHEKKKCCSLGVNGLPKGESYLILSGWGLERSQQGYARFT